MSFPVWALGMEPGFLLRAASACKCCIISPVCFIPWLHSSMYCKGLIRVLLSYAWLYDHYHVSPLPWPGPKGGLREAILASLSKSSNLLLIKRKKSGCEDKTKMFISCGKEKLMPPFQFFKLFREGVAREQSLGCILAFGCCCCGTLNATACWGSYFDLCLL